MTSNPGLLCAHHMGHYANGASLPRLLTAEEERSLLLQIHRARLNAWRSITAPTIRRAADMITDHEIEPAPEHRLSLTLGDDPAPTIESILHESSRRSTDGRRRAAIGIENLAALMQSRDCDCSLLMRIADKATDVQRSKLRSAASAFHRVRNRFVNANLRLPIAAASRIRTWQSHDERVQLGNLGLLKAVNRFDIKHDVRFSTYGMWWIRHTITRGAQRIRRYDDEAIDVMHSGDDPEREAGRVMLHRSVKRLLDDLGDPLATATIVGRFGLEGDEEMTLEEIGEREQYSREWVRQHGLRAESYLRAHLAAEMR